MISTEKNNILPLMYKISHEDLVRVSPTLAGIFSRSWDEGIENLAKEVRELVDEKKKQFCKFLMYCEERRIIV